MKNKFQPALFDFDGFEDDFDESSSNSGLTNPEKIITNISKAIIESAKVNIPNEFYFSNLTDGQIDQRVRTSLGWQKIDYKNPKEVIQYKKTLKTYKKTFYQIILNAKITPEELSNSLARLIFEECEVVVKNIDDGLNEYQLLAADEQKEKLNRSELLHRKEAHNSEFKLSLNTKHLLTRVVEGTNTIAGFGDPDLAVFNGLKLLWKAVNDQARSEANKPLEVVESGGGN